MKIQGKARNTSNLPVYVRIYISTFLEMSSFYLQLYELVKYSYQVGEVMGSWDAIVGLGNMLSWVSMIANKVMWQAVVGEVEKKFHLS